MPANGAAGEKAPKTDKATPKQVSFRTQKATISTAVMTREATTARIRTKREV